MTTQTHSSDRSRLLLIYVGFDGVEFDLFDVNGERLRPVRVNVGSATSWRRAVRFPEVQGASTASTGNDQLDRAIRERAAEELVRFAAVAAALRVAA